MIPLILIFCPKKVTLKYFQRWTGRYEFLQAFSSSHRSKAKANRTNGGKKEGRKWINPSKNQFVPKLFATHSIAFSFFGGEGAQRGVPCFLFDTWDSSISFVLIYS
jgi:hypothetical protein